MDSSGFIKNPNQTVAPEGHPEEAPNKTTDTKASGVPSTGYPVGGSHAFEQPKLSRKGGKGKETKGQPKVSKPNLPTLTKSQQSRSAEAPRGPLTPTSSGRPATVAAAPAAGGEVAAGIPEAPPTTAGTAATDAGKGVFVGALPGPLTGETRANAKADVVASGNPVLPLSADAKAIAAAGKETSGGATTTTSTSLDQGGPWTVVTAKRSNKPQPAKKANPNTGSTLGNVTADKRKKRPNAMNRWKRRLQAKNAPTPVAAVKFTKTPDPKPSTSGGQPSMVETPRSTKEGSGKTKTLATTGVDNPKNSTSKRHCPEDRTTPSEVRKKARTGATPKTYAAAAKSDLIAAVTATNRGHLSREQAEEVQGALNTKLWSLVQARTGKPPMFQGKPTYMNGSLQLWCMNAETMEWVKGNIDGHTLTSGVKVEVRRQSDLPRKVRCGILIPGQDEANKIGEALRYFNPWAEVDRWLLHIAQKQAAGTFIVVSIPEDLIPSILERGRQLCYMLGAVYVKFEERKGKFTDVPPQSRKTEQTVTEQPKSTQMVVEEHQTQQPGSSCRINDPPEGTLSDTAHDPTNADMASDGDEAVSVGEFALGIEELDLGSGDDSEDGVPFTL